MPGPYSLAEAVEPRWLVRWAMQPHFGQRLADVNAREQRERGGYADACVQFASRFSWRLIAQATLSVYQRGLQAMGS